ncbi:nitroreductase family protein [Paenibacillus agricola]|uniref:Nitroreductase family protein n=1 Tax=Paenibacillus agricola TaxID=2716264 RepID=A0ABX0J0K4_9BACL|nr:nitroreductase family protein [Paenibacillus agricola]NHN29498.1 nitroreductase family protein [Paenibacillus agricola]
MSETISALQQLTAEVEIFRKPEFPVHPLFLNRWSPRSFSDQKVSDDDLHTILEAAHWAPSSYNDQPWRFIFAKTDEQLAIFRGLLSEFNRMWASSAPVLILVASDKLRENGDPNAPHSFDSGAAWGYLALQAKILGLATHAIGGFDKAEARRLLNIPEQFELHCVVALGYQGGKETLSAGLQEREVPNTRRPLGEVIYEGKVNA